MNSKQKRVARWVCLFLAAMFVLPTVIALIIR